VARTLADLVAACGPDRPVAVGRELTKVHEELWRGGLGAAMEWLGTVPPRGEWVLVVGPAHLEDAPGSTKPTETEIVAALRARLADGSDRREAVAGVAGDLRVPKREVYQLAVGLGGLRQVEDSP
jgi:16S rRNA (cytidine1402-2'-O)-methyltransferase